MRYRAVLAHDHSQDEKDGVDETTMVVSRGCGRAAARWMLRWSDVSHLRERCPRLWAHLFDAVLWHAFVQRGAPGR